MNKPLRDYQREAALAAIEGFAREIPGVGGPFEKQLLVEPTGSGKTVIFSAMTEYWLKKHDKPVLILADQTDLLDQARAELLEFTGLYGQIEQAERTAMTDARVVIATVQTLAHRLDKYGPDYFGLVIADEADKSVSDLWQKVLKHYDSFAKVLGVTATPDRADQRSVMDYYQRIAHETALFDLIDKGYLSRIMVKTVPLQIDISHVTQTAGDYDKEELDKILTPYFGKVCEAIKTEAAGRKTLAFLPLIETSKRFVEVARDHGIRAAHVDGNAADRNHIKEQFRHRKIDLLANAMLLGRGYNDKSIDCIVNLRPTRSPSLYRQFVGRGTRTWCPQGCAMRCEHTEAKQDLLLLDFIWQHHRLGLQRPANLVARDGDHAAKLTDYSQRQSGRMLELQGIDSLVAKEAEVALLESLKRAAKRARPGYYDAMEYAVRMHQRELMDYTPVAHWEEVAVSEKQAAALDRIGIDPATVANRGMASRILSLEFGRRDKKLATFRQTELLRKVGVKEPTKVRFEDASVYLDSKFNHTPLPAGFKLYAADEQPTEVEEAAPEEQAPPAPNDEPVFAPRTERDAVNTDGDVVALVDTDDGGEVVTVPVEDEPEPEPAPVQPPTGQLVEDVEPDYAPPARPRAKSDEFYRDGFKRIKQAVQAVLPLE